jgi:hypothetical protein
MSASGDFCSAAQMASLRVPSRPTSPLPRSPRRRWHTLGGVALVLVAACGSDDTIAPGAPPTEGAAASGGSEGTAGGPARAGAAGTHPGSAGAAPLAGAGGLAAAGTAGQTSNGGTAGQTSNGGAAGQTSNGGTAGQTSNGGTAGQTSNGGAAGQTSNGGAAGQTSNGGTAGASGGAGALSAAGVTGTIGDGLVVHIQALAGENFGTQGPPKVQVADRFAGKKATDPRDPNTPDIGAFTVYGNISSAAPHTEYAEEEYLSDGASYRAFQLGSWGLNLGASRLQLASPAKVREVFVSANLFFPPGGWGPPVDAFVDADGFPIASMMKVFWAEDGPKGGSVGGSWDQVFFSVVGINTWAPGGSNETLLNNRGDGVPGAKPAFPTKPQHATKEVLPFGKWSLLQFGFQEPATLLGPTPAAFRRASIQNDGTVYAERDDSQTYIPFVDGVTTSFDNISVNAWIRDQVRATTAADDIRRIYLDDVYMALGPGAMCRVEVHDVEDDAKATVLSVSPVVAGNWKTDEITTTLRFNRYFPASPVGYYLKVYGANGARITARKITAP